AGGEEQQGRCLVRNAADAAPPQSGSVARARGRAVRSVRTSPVFCPLTHETPTRGRASDTSTLPGYSLVSGAFRRLVSSCSLRTASGRLPNLSDARQSSSAFCSSPSFI